MLLHRRVIWFLLGDNVEGITALLLKEYFRRCIAWCAALCVRAVICHTALGRREVLCEAKIDEFDVACVLLDHDVLGLEVAEDDALLVQVVKEQEGLGGKVPDKRHRDADLVPLELVQSDPFDGFHHKVHVLLRLER